MIKAMYRWVGVSELGEDEVGEQSGGKKWETRNSREKWELRI